METYSYESLAGLIFLFLICFYFLRDLYYEYKREGFKNKSIVGKSNFIRGVMLCSTGVIISTLLIMKCVLHLINNK